MKIYLIGIFFVMLEGCTQPQVEPNIDSKHISCDNGFNDKVSQYSLESLERLYRCKNLKEVAR